MEKSGSQVVKFLDVGHGDSAVIYLKSDVVPNIKTVVIDIPDSGKVLEELKSANIKTVDLLIITHFDSDHCKGVNDFLQKFSLCGAVKKICYNLDRSVPTKNMKIFLKQFLELYRKSSIQIRGGELDTDKKEEKLLEWGNSQLYLIYPNKAESTEAYISGKTNDMSVITLLKGYKGSILFSGDLEKKGWTSLLKRMPELTCQILKMPHHGGYYKGTRKLLGSEKILDALHPQKAVISTAQNEKYRHPDERTIKLLKSMGIGIYCTQYTDLCRLEREDRCRKCYGDITVSETDEGYQVTAEQESFPLCLNCEG